MLGRLAIVDLERWIERRRSRRIVRSIVFVVLGIFGVIVWGRELALEWHRARLED